MARINLLPWREEARQQRRKDFLAAGAVALAITFAGAVAVHLYNEHRIESQQARNAYLTSQIKTLDKQIQEIQDLEKTKDDLLARMDIIQKLQTSRPEIVRLFDELVNALPAGVYLTKLQQAGRSVTIEGRAQSNARVSAFMSRVEASKSIGKPRLMLIENKDKTGTGLSHFRLSFDQVSPNPEPEVEKPVPAKGKRVKPGKKPPRKR